MKKALITGITGQTGSYLAQLLIKKNYIVYGIKRRTSSVYNTQRLEQVISFDKYLNKKLFLFYADLTDYSSLEEIILRTSPDEIYNLGAQSHVQTSFLIPNYTSEVNSMGVLNILNIIKNSKKKIRFYQASTSEMFGNQRKFPLNEKSTMNPVSPYGISKLFAYHMVRCYRDSYKIFASNGILFNHESPLRGENFVTRKITIGLSKIYLGLTTQPLELGGLNAQRDWGHAREYANAIWKIIQYKKPIDLVICSEKFYSVRDFIEVCLKYLGIKYKFLHKNTINEKIISNKKILVQVNKKYFRPIDIIKLEGDYRYAKKILKWKCKTKINQLAKEMIDSDIKILKGKVI